MKRQSLFVAALLLSSAVAVFMARAARQPLTLESYANLDQIGPGESVNYTLAVRRSAAERGDVSVRIEVDRGLTIWTYGSGTGGCGGGGQVLVCVVPVSASEPGLIFLSVRANMQPRCGMPFVSSVRATTKFTSEAAELQITTTTDPCTWLPLIAPEPTRSPYPPPSR